MTDFSSQSTLNIDNAFSSALKRLGFTTMLLQTRFHPRSSAPANEIVYQLMLAGVAKNLLSGDVLLGWIIEI
jgi:hypothetical protein